MSGSFSDEPPENGGHPDDETSSYGKLTVDSRLRTAVACLPQRANLVPLLGRRGVRQLFRWTRVPDPKMSQARSIRWHLDRSSPVSTFPPMLPPTYLQSPTADQTVAGYVLDALKQKGSELARLTRQTTPQVAEAWLLHVRKRTASRA